MDRTQRKDYVRDNGRASDYEEIPQSGRLDTDDSGSVPDSRSPGIPVSLDGIDLEAPQIVEQLEAALEKIIARQKIRAQALGVLLRRALPAVVAADPRLSTTLRTLQRVYRRKN